VAVKPTVLPPSQIIHTIHQHKLRFSRISRVRVRFRFKLLHATAVCVDR